MASKTSTSVVADVRRGYCIVDIHLTGIEAEIEKAKSALDHLLSTTDGSFLLGVYPWHGNARSFSGLRGPVDALLATWRKETGVTFQ